MGANFLQALVAGGALGAKYALVALGFVIVFRATKVLNFTQGLFVLLGAYLTYALSPSLGFYGAALVSVAAVAVVAALTYEGVVRHLNPNDHFAIIMVTVALLLCGENLVTAIWGSQNRNLGDPWGVQTVRLGNTAMALRDVAAIAVCMLLVALVFAVFKHTRIGLGMRAVAQDDEAAVTLGMRPRWLSATAWALAGAVGAVAGIFLATGTAAVQPGLALAAFAALPAVMLGGVDSAGGAVVGGLLIGVLQQVAAFFQPVYLPQLGQGFAVIVPYLVMIVILLIRPNGLFGSVTVRRL